MPIPAITRARLAVGLEAGVTTARVAPACWLALACLLAASAIGRAQIRDSAGIRIIDNPQPIGGAAAPRRVSTAPAVVIGNQGGEPYELSDIAGTVRLADGTIVVADGGSKQLRFYDRTGRYLRAVGRSGQGPGEFTELETLTRLTGDTLIAGRMMFGGHSVFTGNGTFVRRLGTVPYDPRTTMRMSVGLGVLDNQSTVFGSFAGRPDARPGVSRWIDSMPLLVMGRDGTVGGSLGTFPAMVVSMDQGTPSMTRFAPTATWTARGNDFYYGFGGEYSIRVFSGGRLTRIIRRRWTPTRITAAEIDRYADGWARSWITSTGAQAEREKREFRASPFSDVLPAFVQFLVDPAGSLWVRLPTIADAAADGSFSYQPLVASTWNVFDREGRWTGDVTMPARFFPTDIGLDYVLGKSRDTDGIETVVMYRLER